MTEQEKMKKGYLWGDDEENMALQAHTKGLVNQFNNLPPEDMEGRAALLMYGLSRRLRLRSGNMCPSEREPMRI